jgi:hypothetical protein
MFDKLKNQTSHWTSPGFEASWVVRCDFVINYRARHLIILVRDCSELSCWMLLCVTSWGVRYCIGQKLEISWLQGGS